MSDFIERAEKALSPLSIRAQDSRPAHLRRVHERAQSIKALLREAITEVRERDERLSGQDFATDELRVALKEENAACKRLEARIEALEGQVQVADMLANKLKAENAKLREAVRAVLDDACPAEQGDETLVKSHLVSDLSAALGSDAPGDAS